MGSRFQHCYQDVQMCHGSRNRKNRFMLIPLVFEGGRDDGGTKRGGAFRTEASERRVRNTRHSRDANCRTTSSPMLYLAPVMRAMPGIDKP